MVVFYGRISIEIDELRRKLEEKLGISAPKNLERALVALDRELNSVQPAE